MQDFEKYLDEVILTTQACQRNWNLDREIPEKHINIIVNSMTLCPSKQNLDFYSLKIITNRDVIDKLYYTTQNRGKTRYNPQVLANMLVVFVANNPSDPRSTELANRLRGKASDLDKKIIQDDQILSVGIAAGIGAHVANLLGYRTGYCKCFDSRDVKKILGLKDEPFLMLGVGYPNEEQSRNIDHKTGKSIEPCKKINIKVEYIR
jgi:hypothetical protein